MTTTQTIATTISTILLLFCACKENKAERIPISEDLIETTAISEPSPEEKRAKNRESQIRDSLRLDRVLNEAVSKAKLHSFNSSFKEAFQAFPDSVFHVDVELNYDFHFNRTQRHLIIRRSCPTSNQIDVYIYSNGTLKNILGKSKWAMEHTGDTLADVNGDGLKDLIVNWYGTSGCCLKGFSDVYLMRDDLRSFSAKNEFINPTFSSREGVIRGVCYGHPGETELYKFKWSGETIDTVEYVSYERGADGKQTGKVIVSNFYPTHKDYTELRKVNSVPAEYRSIEGFNWFTNDLKER